MRNGRVGPEGLALAVAMAGATATTPVAQGSGWWDGFAGHGPSTSAVALTVYKGDVVVGGWFYYTTGPYMPARKIARWDGTNWHAFGQGLEPGIGDFPCPPIPACEGRVLSLVADGDMLYVGGLFPSVSQGPPGAIITVPARNIAAWDGTHWMALGGGIDAHVSSLTIFRGDLIAAGDFSEVDGQPMSRIARWDGTSWHSLGAGLDAVVTDLIVHDDRLVVVGSFQLAGGVTARRVASWDGSAWAPIGAGFESGTPGVVDVYQGWLLVGEVIQASEQIRGYAQWDGTSWVPLAPNTGINAHCSAVFHGELIIGGLVNAQGDGIVRWNGSMWVSLDGGVAPGDRLPSAKVQDLVVLGDHLFVAGDFLLAGGIHSPFIARWDGEPTPVVLTDLEAAAYDDAVRIVWRLAPSSLHDVTGVWVQRAEAEPGPFARVSAQLLAEPVMFYVDRDVTAGGTYFYRLEFALADGTQETSHTIGVSAAGVGGSPALVSSSWTGDGSGFEIRYRVGPVRREVRLAVFDVRGRLIRNVFDGWADPGTHTARWTLTDGAERQAPNGVYFLQLVSGRATDRQRLTVVR